MFSFKKQPILLILTCFLAFLGLAYLTKGFYTLIWDGSPKGARDLLERWREQQYIYLKTYPYYMDSSEIDLRLGEVRSGGYPPWAFFTGFFIFPNLSWPLTRIYQALLNIVSIGILIRFAYGLGLPFGKLPASFFVAACLAFSANSTTLNNGQYGIIINAFLIGVHDCIQTRKNVLAGILMGIALAKPNISAPFLFALAIQQKIRSIFIAFFYIIFATFFIATLTRTGFNNVVYRFLNQIKYVADDGFSAINIFKSYGIEMGIALVGLIFLTCGAGALVFWTLRHAPLLTLFAVASVIGRVFIYHRSYDDVMLVFLLLALLKLVFQQPSLINIIIVFLLGITLWIPVSVQNIFNPPWSYLQMLIWLGCTLYILGISLTEKAEKIESDNT